MGKKIRKRIAQYERYYFVIETAEGWKERWIDELDVDFVERCNNALKEFEETQSILEKLYDSK